MPALNVIYPGVDQPAASRRHSQQIKPCPASARCAHWAGGACTCVSHRSKRIYTGVVLQNITAGRHPLEPLNVWHAFRCKGLLSRDISGGLVVDSLAPEVCLFLVVKV